MHPYGFRMRDFTCTYDWCRSGISSDFEKRYFELDKRVIVREFVRPVLWFVLASGESQRKSSDGRVDERGRSSGFLLCLDRFDTIRTLA